MNLSRPLKLLLLAFTLWLPLYMISFFAIVSLGPRLTPEGFDLLFTIHFATVVINIALMIYYVVHVFRSKRVASDKRALWGISLFCGGPIAMPVYFFNYIWPDEPEAV